MAILTNQIKWKIGRVLIMAFKYASLVVLLPCTLICIAIEKLNDFADYFMNNIVGGYTRWVLQFDRVKCRNCIYFDEAKMKNKEICHLHVAKYWTLTGRKSAHSSNQVWFSKNTRYCEKYIPKESELLDIEKD